MRKRKISKNPLVMENDLRNIAQGIDKNSAVWAPEAPKKQEVLDVADEIQTFLGEIEAADAIASQKRLALKLLLEGRATDICKVVHGIVMSLFPGKETDFGISPRKAPEKHPIPEMPIGIKIEAVTATTIELTWNPVTHAKYYKVFIGTDPQTSKMTSFQNTTRAHLVLTRLQEGTKYYISIKAGNASGESNFSYPADCRTQ
jgi:hypothetical protein